MGSETNSPSSSPEVQEFLLTKEFIETVFEVEVETFSTGVGTNPGDNNLSLIHSAEVTFKGEKGAKHYLIKCYPNHPARREFLDQLNIFEKELFVYNEFFPLLQNMLKERGVENIINFFVPPVHAGNLAKKPSPKFIDGPWANENFIVMTDLRKPLGYRMGDRFRGLDLDHSKLAVQEIAKLHALSWAYKKLHGLSYLSSKFELFLDPMYQSSAKEIDEQFEPFMKSISDSTLKAVEESIGSSHPACVQFKALVSKNVMEFLRMYCKKEGIDEDLIEDKLRIKPENDNAYVKEPWLVTTHGDYWVNNNLFLYDDNLEPPKLKGIAVLDFQMVRETCPTIDLAFFLNCSLRASVRKAHKAELLRVYHDAFVQFCEVLQVELLPGFSYETLQRRVKRAGIYGILIALPLLTFVLRPSESVDLDALQVNDMEDVFSTIGNENDKNTVLKEEITSIVLELYEEGII